MRIALALLLLFACAFAATDVQYISQLAAMAANRYCDSYVDSSNAGSKGVCFPYKLDPTINLVDPYPIKATGEIPEYTQIRGRVGLGYDISMGSFGLPVLDMSYNQKTYVDPYSKKTYAVPDEVLITPFDISAPGSSVTTAKAYQYYQNYVDSLQWFNEPSSTDKVTAYAGMMSHSADLKSMYDKYFGGELSLGVAHIKSTAYHLDVMPTKTLDPYFEAAIDYLPAEYDANIYHTFLQYWGTHTTTHAELGGLLERSNMVKECSWNHGNVNANSLEDDMIHELNGDAGKPDVKKPGQTYINFRKVSSTDILGGNPEIPFDRYQERVKTFVENPIQTSFSVTRMTAYIPDPVKRANIDRAINEWFAAKRANAVKQKQAAIDAHNAWLAGPQRIQSGFYTGMPGLTPHVDQSATISKGQTLMMYYETHQERHCHRKWFKKHCHTDTKQSYYGNAPIQLWCQRDGEGRVRAMSGTGNTVNGRAGFATVGPWVREGCSIAAPYHAGENPWTLEEGAGTGRAVWGQSAGAFGMPGSIGQLVSYTYHACCIGCGLKTSGSQMICTCEPF